MERKNYGTLKNVDDERIPIYPTYTKKYEGPRFLGVCRTEFLFSVFLFTYLLYLFCGAAIFSILEGPGEQAMKAKLDSVINKFLVDHPNVTDQALEDLITEIVKASNRGVSAARNASGEPNWSFGQSLFFSTTVVTTIGYGHVTPLSRSGKVFCVLYAVVGIPLTLVLLSALVERLLVPTIWLLQWLNSRLGHLYQPFNIRLLHLFIIVSLMVGLFLLIPATIFAAIEPEWDFLDSFYYCFISLTTIGLGDYIPGDSPDQPYRPFYKIATTGYLFFGITFMMLTLAVFYDIPQLNLGLLFTTNEDTNSEKVRLAGAGHGLQYGAGGTFSPQSSDENNHRQVVRVRSRRDDSPSPEEGPIKELRLS
ncbi:unnamed protein product [Brassicogethes aeneus]|uniref:Potassium channel domain-containing protein n=1 Tax=Brassicogethes aeneus TaxID=1431903 RepID=A0A9P0B3I8_BRAAE|nr:unnamed protein product [Brassicogethes aeneus]